MSIVMGMQNFIKIYQKVQGIGPVFTFFRIWTSAKPRPIPNINLIGYILSISMCMQNFITIFHSIQEIEPFSLFQNLELGKASTNFITLFFTFLEIGHFHFSRIWSSAKTRPIEYVGLQSLGLDQCLRKSLSKYSTQFKRKGHFHFFRIRHSAKPRPMINVILQFLGLDFSTSTCLQNFIKIFQTAIS